MILPVLILEEALVELPGGVAGKLVAEINTPRTLHVGQVLATVGDQLTLELGPGVDPLGRLHDGFDLLAEVLVRHAEDGDIVPDPFVALAPRGGLPVRLESRLSAS